MPRTVSRFLVAVVPVLVWMTAGTFGQSTGQPSTKNGDWPSYNADVRGSRYSEAPHNASSNACREKTRPGRCASARSNSNST